MPIKENRTFAISPGTREIGIAVFEDLDLLYYATKDLGKHRQGNTIHSVAREAVRLIEDMIYKYQPTEVLLQELCVVQALSPKLVYLTEQIKIATARRNVALHEPSAAEARKSLCPYERATKRKAAARLATLYPELARYVREVSLWQQLYYAPMFDAVSIGYTFQQVAARARESTTLMRSDRL